MPSRSIPYRFRGGQIAPRCSVSAIAARAPAMSPSSTRRVISARHASAASDESPRRGEDCSEDVRGRRLPNATLAVDQVPSTEPSSGFTACYDCESERPGRRGSEVRMRSSVDRLEPGCEPVLVKGLQGRRCGRPERRRLWRDASGAPFGDRSVGIRGVSGLTKSGLTLGVRSSPLNPFSRMERPSGPPTGLCYLHRDCRCTDSRPKAREPMRSANQLSRRKASAPE